MPTQYAPVGMTIEDDAVRSTRQPGQPGRPPTAQQEDDTSETATSTPTLLDIARAAEAQGVYVPPSRIEDPAYWLNAEIDYALNYVDEWAFSLAAKHAFSRAMRSWQAFAGVSKILTDAEWKQAVGLRKMEKPLSVSSEETHWWLRQYDAELAMEKMARSGRNPYIQTLLGSIVGGAADPINIGITAATAGLGSMGYLGLGATGSAIKTFTNIVAGAKYGKALARSKLFTGLTSAVDQAVVAAPIEMAVADRYGEQYGAAEMGIDVAVDMGLSLLAAGGSRLLRSARLTVGERLAATAKAVAVVDGTPDADLVTPRSVDEHLQPTDAFDNIPLSKVTLPRDKNPFDRTRLEVFERGPQLELAKFPPGPGRIAAFRKDLELGARRAARVWERAYEAAKAAGLIDQSSEFSPHIHDIMRIALADRAVGAQGRLAPVVTASLRRYIKKVPKGVAVRGTRLVDTVRANNLTAPQVRQIAEDLLPHLGVSREYARAMVLSLSRDEALSWIDGIMTAARGVKIPEGAAPMRAVLDVVDTVPPPIKGSPVVRNTHKALWLAAENASYASRAVVDWLSALGVRVDDHANFSRALVEAGERYKADYKSGARLDPLEYLEDALWYEQPHVFEAAPEDRARGIAESVAKGEPVSPSDAVPLRTLVGSEDIATPAVSSALRAEVDTAVQTGKIGDLTIDDTIRSALSDVAVGVDRLTDALRVCIRK